MNYDIQQSGNEVQIISTVGTIFLKFENDKIVYSDFITKLENSEYHIWKDKLEQLARKVVSLNVSPCLV